MMLPMASAFWALIQISLLCGMAIAVAWVLRGRKPQWTSAFLNGVCVASMALGLLALIPSLQWSAFIEHGRSDSLVILAQENTSATNGVAEEKKEDSISPPTSVTTGFENKNNSEVASIPIGDWLRTWLDNQVQYFDEGVRAVERKEQNQQSMIYQRLVSIAGIGLFFAASLWGVGWFAMRRVIAESKLSEDPRLLEKVSQFASQMKLRKRPEVRVSDRVPIGATVGFWKSVLVLRTDWENWREQELDAVLHHELAHIARHDFLWVIVSSWVQIIFFFHPLVHLVVRRLRMEQELAADQLASGAMKNAQAYGRALASLALRGERTRMAMGPMLSAEQVCVIRRITMLRQGSLLPKPRIWRWATALTIATILFGVVPLSGLRGSAPPSDEAGSKEESIHESIVDSNTKKDQSEEEDKKHSESYKKMMEVNAKFPPLEWTATTVWRPGRFHSQDFLPSMKLAHLQVSFMYFGGLAEDGEIFGKVTSISRWEDIERVTGINVMKAEFSDAHQVDPKLFGQWLGSPYAGVRNRTNIAKMIGGHLARGISHGKWVDDKFQMSDEPSTWLIEEDGLFMHGTEDEIAEKLKNARKPIGIPDTLLHDYSSAAFAVVFEDCSKWEEEASAFVKGSPKAIEAAIFLPILKGLKHVGCFVEAKEESFGSIKMIYNDEESADQAKGIVEGFIAMGRASLTNTSDPDEVGQLKILDTLRISQVGSELRIESLQSDAFDFAMSQRASNIQLPGWYISAFNVKEDESVAVAKSTIDESPRSYWEGTEHTCSPGFVAQSIAASSYQGKRVQLQAKVATHESTASRVGLFLWGSDSQHRTLCLTSESVDGTSDLPELSKFSQKKAQKYGIDELVWKTVQIEMDVPVGCEELSFGAYGKVLFGLQAIKIRTVRSGESLPKPTQPFLQYNLFTVAELPKAGLGLQPQPINLEIIPRSKDQSEAQVAERTDKVVK